MAEKNPTEETKTGSASVIEDSIEDSIEENKHYDKAVINFKTEQGLRDIYYDPKTGYQSMARLYQKAKDSGLGVSRASVKNWLENQRTYTRFRPLVKKHKYQKTFVSDLGEQIQMDLIDMGKYKKDNNNFYWILTAIEILSRFAFAIPVYKKDTKNMTEAIKLLLKQFYARFGRYPEKAQFDEGKEFYNVGVRELLKTHNITYFSTHSQKKAAVVERFNRTLKTAMWKYFYKNSTNNWVDVLEELTYGYNNTKHSSILMKPANVNEKNKNHVFVTLFGYGNAAFPVPKFKVGDPVRISKYKSTFKKGYEANFTEEVFKVTKVFRGDPNMYEIEDDNSEKILGKFYQQEMSLVGKEHTYSVEKILKKKNGMVFVKWVGYDNDHNSWISEKNIPK